MKDKRRLIIFSVSLIAVILLIVALVNFFTDKNKLNKTEKNWIANNLNTVQSIYVINNASVFGDNGSGVFYDFLKDFQTDYHLEINPITFQQGEEVKGIAFNSGNKVRNLDRIFYEDHYIVIGKEDQIISSIESFANI